MLEPTQDFGEIAPAEDNPIVLRAHFAINTPGLQVELDGQDVLLSWPTAALGSFVLESSDQISGP